MKKKKELWDWGFSKSCILQQHLQRKILKRAADEAKKRSSKSGRANEILEKHLGNTNNISTVVDAVYAMGWTIDKRKGSKWNEKLKEKKNQEGLKRLYRDLKSRFKNWERSWLGYQMKFIGGWLEANQLKGKEDSAKAEKKLVRNGNNWAEIKS